MGAQTGRLPRVLPPEVVASLRDAFAEEVAARLPRLRAVAADPAVLTGAVLDDAVRDAHSLGSSAIVVDEPDASRRAREVEALLGGWSCAPDEARLGALVGQLTAALSGWSAR